MNWIKQEFARLSGAGRRWLDDDGPLLSTSVAYYLGLSFFPMLLLIIAGFGMFLNYTVAGHNAEQEVLQMLSTHLSPALETQAQKALTNLKGKSLWTGPLAFAGVILAAIAGFAQLDRAFDHIWRTPPAPERGIMGTVQRVLIKRGTAFLMLLGIGLITIAIFVVDVVLSSITRYTSEMLPGTEIAAQIGNWALTLVVNWAMFLLLYRLLPNAYVQWRHSARGAVVATICWEIGRKAMTILLVGSSYSSAYGILGTFLAVQVWCYYAIAIVLLGAEYIQEIAGVTRPAEARDAANGDKSAELKKRSAVIDEAPRN